MKFGKRATTHEVVRQPSGLAVVSRALNDLTPVKKLNVNRLLVAIAGLEYRTDLVAPELRCRQRRFLAASLPEPNSPFFGALSNRIQGATAKTGDKVRFSTLRESEEREGSGDPVCTIGVCPVQSFCMYCDSPKGAVVCSLGQLRT